MSRLVVDTSVLVSAALSAAGKPRTVIDRVAALRGSLMFCDATWLELDTVLRRPKFARFLSDSRRRDVMAAFGGVSEWVEISGTLKACRDPKDDMILETALRGRADAVITGDRDLLVLHPFESIPILTPARWLERV